MAESNMTQWHVHTYVSASPIMEAVFTANHLTDTDKQNSTGEYTNEIQLTKANNAKYSKTGLVASYDTRPGNEMGLFCNTPEPTWGNYWQIKCNGNINRHLQ